MIPLDVQSAWARRCKTALDLIAALRIHGRWRPIWLKNADFSPALLRLHGDCHPGNILWTPPTNGPAVRPALCGPGRRPHGPGRAGPVDAAVGRPRQRTRQLGALVDGYEQFRPFDRRELALIEPLRTLRLIHYSAWLARRWEDPIFPINFPWFGSSDYWQGQVQMLEEQIEAMQEEPLVGPIPARHWRPHRPTHRRHPPPRPPKPPGARRAHPRCH
jgi:Ser/Thr protein kinase RdoA (MazF antagonist)